KILSNNADNSAGVLMLNGTVKGCLIKDNFAYGMAGGMRVQYATVVHCSFENNDASKAGALFIHECVVANCIFKNNKAIRETTFDGRGGGVVSRSSATLINCIFVAN